MTTLLQINTSLFAEGGTSSKLANQFVDAWRQQHADGQVVVRDLGSEPLPHLSAERFRAFLTPSEERTEAQQAHAAASDELINELKAADVIVLGLPMYNFGIPSTLKAYFDHIARAGVTFRYTANGPEGLISDRKVYVFAARGGMYQGTPRDTQTRYVIDFLNFIGLRDIEFVYAEGLNLGDASRKNALDAAAERIEVLAA
ncbi:FMN-dependent NADH-azoreductase [Sinimarinibacterium sp. CAU 1509]|uniref:FMN-dependent NADH-azoreductase n=1 Tax=Sinimarinibacterium sp. CAU 1509 TaxID=2562283 RepID=UPI0010AC04D3|nr:NAD(P)H-dependent oxidoreductase [Sinimarinibacterium sp. CAU 1509]TJY59305.1 FMN-dependent NADH-azoreductase [Sinimarinibacterium sp. CAU 1509]